MPKDGQFPNEIRKNRSLCAPGPGQVIQVTSRYFVLTQYRYLLGGVKKRLRIREETFVNLNWKLVLKDQLENQI